MLKGKTIWLTGALGKLGSSAVPMLLEQGATVIASDLKPLDEAPAIRELAETVGESRLLYIQADMTDETQVREAVETIDRVFGRLDGGYFNAYVNVWKPVLSLTLEEWERTLKGTLTSAFLCCKYALPLMIRSGGGSIVNTSSALGHIAKKGGAGYGSGKAGLNQLTKIIAKEHAESGIRANAIVPGDFKSDEVLARQTEAQKEAMRQEALLGRSARADEINRVALFLLSDASSYMTASLVTVDGGFHV